MNANIKCVESIEDNILVLGGTGKTGRRIAERLASRGVRTRVASRGADPSFDWNDRSTWEAALDGVTAVWVSYAPDLAIPGATDTIRNFADFARRVADSGTWNQAGENQEAVAS